MADERHNTMNLDLNLGPGSAATEDEHVNVDEWVDDSADRLREAVRRTSRRRWREHRSEDPFGSLSLDWNQFLASVSNQGGLHLGEGSVAVEERATEIGKMLESKADEVDDAALECDGVDEKGTGGEESFYDCNICFELAKDPIITCCGHLYCWSCIYQWLHYSEMKECPVCKGEVTTKNVTPIYGRGHNNRAVEEDLTLRIPPRPSARRVESVVRSFPIPMEEMIRRLGNRFDLSREFSANQDMGSAADRYTNTSNMLSRLMMSRARERMRAPPENTVDLTQSQAAGPDTVGVSRPQHRLIRMHAATSRSINTSSPSPSYMSASERVMEAYIRSHPVIVRRPEQSPSVDDRDSFSSIAAVMNSGSQNIDTAVEIDSVVSLSTSSSRRRNDTSRASDIDSGDSRPLRRRRLN